MSIEQKKKILATPFETLNVKGIVSPHARNVRCEYVMGSPYYTIIL